jgi:FkbM family methyltransferase
MHGFEKLVHRREETVSGVGPWYWLKEDTGAWIGPKADWEGHHSDKWFRHVKDYRVCVQAGACLGMYPRLLSDRFDVVYSFEPDRLNFYVANLNCQVGNVFLWNAALGHEASFTGLERQFRDNVGMHRVKDHGPIPIVAIDNLNLPYCDLLALDLEGYEVHALTGATETIDRCSPVITCECPSQGVKDLLRVLGYAEDCVSVSDVVYVRA